MGDPELRSDETILVRTHGIYVKSIPFEGILTNRRILLFDKAKGFQPPKEVTLASLKDVEPGENAIRDQVITLSMVTKTGETRQMILTFSRQAGGNRIKERDEWMKFLRVHTGPSFEQSVRRSAPAPEQEVRFPEQPSAPRIEIINSPIPQNPQGSGRIPIRKEVEAARPVKRIIESAPAQSPEPVRAESAPIHEPPAPSFGLYCSRCGNKVAESSAFCNRCGSPIASPASAPAAVHPAAPQPVRETVSEPVPASRRNEKVTGQIAIPVDDELSWEDMPEQPVRPIRQQIRPTIPAMIPEEEFDQEPSIAPTPPESRPPVKVKKARKGFLPRLFSPKELGPTPLKPESMPTRSTPPSPKKPKRRSGPGWRPGKKTIIAAVGIVIIIVVLLAGVLVVYPMISVGGLKLPGGSSSGTTTPTPSATTTTGGSSTPSAQGTLVIPKETTPVPIPATGVYVHVDYIGGWKGTYGTPAETQSVQDSGEKILEVVNATGTVQATIAKLDSSTKHSITVEIYKNGKLLTSGSTDAALGKVTLSVDVTTGVAKTPQTSPGTAVVATTAPAKAGSTTSPAAANVTVTKTTTPVTNTTAAK